MHGRLRGPPDGLLRLPSGHAKGMLLGKQDRIDDQGNLATAQHRRSGNPRQALQLRPECLDDDLLIATDDVVDV